MHSCEGVSCVSFVSGHKVPPTLCVLCYGTLCELKTVCSKNVPSRTGLSEGSIDVQSLATIVHSVEQKSIGLKFSKPRTGSDV